MLSTRVRRLGFARALARAVGPRGITVNSVALGLIAARVAARDR